VSALKLLIDTHVFLWLADRPDHVAEEARLALEDPVNDVFVSSAVAWEIAIKSSAGKLQLPVEAGEYVRSRISSFGFRTLPISIEHAVATVALPNIHADPFDRILVAQAASEGMTLVTRDENTLRYPVRTLKA
jgi:PIN domain nuclease of toxin-antitoxin system